MAKAIFAGGCFWGMEELIRVRPGVLRTRVGYTGGHVSNPTYRMVCTKTTGHAEAIEIEYDNDLTSYRDLLEFFFKIHDPTTLDRQGNDIGDSYRSEIFTLSNEQENDANKPVGRGACSLVYLVVYKHPSQHMVETKCLDRTPVSED